MIDIFSSHCNYICTHVDSKKGAFSFISQLFSEKHPHLNSRFIFEALNHRERIGNTALEEGVAIPHATLAEIESPLMALIKLDVSIEYDAIDKKPVDLLFAILLPEPSINNHLNTSPSMLLKYIELLCHQPNYCTHLRSAKTNAELYERATHFKPYVDSMVHTLY